MKRLFLIFLSLFFVNFLQSKNNEQLSIRTQIRYCRYAKKHIKKAQKLIKQSKSHIKLERAIKVLPTIKAKRKLFKKFAIKIDKPTPYTTYKNALRDQIKLINKNILKLNGSLSRFSQETQLYSNLKKTILKSEECIKSLSYIKLFTEQNFKKQLKKESPRFKLKKIMKVILIGIVILSTCLLLIEIIPPIMMFGFLNGIGAIQFTFPLITLLPFATYISCKYRVSKQEKVFGK